MSTKDCLRATKVQDVPRGAFCAWLGSRIGPRWIGLRLLPMAALLLIASVPTACSKKRIDLYPTPLPGADLVGLCRTDEEKRLVVSVGNRGNGYASSSTTLVQIDSLPPVILPTRPVAPGGSVEVRLALPDSCFTSGCRVRVVVDARQDATEMDEGNNELIGRCEVGGW